jgi:hypothetical protein
VTELVRYDTNHTPATVEPALTPAIDSWTQVIADVAKLAQHIADTDFVPAAMRGKPAAVAAAILAGREAGVGPMTALQHIFVIKGKPGQSAQLMRQLVLSAGHEIRYVETTDTRCVVEGRRRGEQEWARVSFTADQARKAQIALGGYPEDKLVARATTRLCRRKFADCIGGMPYTVEELEDGDYDHETPDTTEAQPEPKPTKPRRTARRKNTTPKPPKTAKPQPAPPEPEAAEPELPDDDKSDPPITPAQLTKLQAIFTENKVPRDLRLRISSVIIERELATSKDLTLSEAGVLIDTLERAAATGDFDTAVMRLVGATEHTDQPEQPALDDTAG